MRLELVQLANHYTARGALCMPAYHYSKQHETSSHRPVQQLPEKIHESTAYCKSEILA